MMKKRKLHFMFLAFVTALALLGGTVSSLATSITPGEGYNTLENSIGIRYKVAGETGEWKMDGGYRITVSNHKIGNWGGYDGWKITEPAAGESYMQYDFQGENDTPPRISQFYTMVNNFTKGVAKVTFNVKKLQGGEILDFGYKFYDVVSAKTVGITDITAEYNAAAADSFVDIVSYVDLSYIGSIDSMIIWAKTDIKAVQFQIAGVKIEWGKTAIATADGYFRGLDNGFNIVFNKMARSGHSREYDWMPVTGYSTEYGNGYNSGRHGFYGFNTGSIKVNNNTTGEYMSFGKGAGDDHNSIGGIWIMFPLDLSRTKVNLRFTIMKKVAGDSAEVKFEFCSKDGGSNVPVTIGGASGLPDGTGLNAMAEGVWKTYDITDVDLSNIATFDGLGIWINAEGAAGQEIYLRNLAIYYDAAGADREAELTESAKTVNGFAFDATGGVKVKSDIYTREYMEFAYASAPSKSVAAEYSAGGLTEGKYKYVMSFKKPAALASDFAFDIDAYNGTEEITALKKSLGSEIKTAAVGKWLTVETAEFEIKGNVPDKYVLATSSGGATDVLELEYIALTQTKEYITQDIEFGVANVFARDFSALNSMGVDEYDFSQNGFPEIGNWSNSFPDLMAQGQLVVRDTDSTPVMKIYRRTQAEIDAAKVEFDWPEGTVYVPADKSHFFVTAPQSAGYFELQITAKRGTDFKGTTDFSLEGYTGSEPWWKLADFTTELAAAEDGEWVTYKKDVYLPKAIDSIKICVETRFEGSDLFIKEIKTIRKQGSASGYFEADKGGDLSWDIVNSGAAINSVKIDGAVVPAANYTVTSDKFTLKSSYLATLANGSFTFTLSNGAEEIEVDVNVSKVNPVVTTSALTVNLKKLKDVVINVDFKGSGLSYIEINGTELEEDVDYIADTDAGTLKLKPSAFSGLEAGEATLTIKTKAGSVDYKITLEEKSNVGWIVGVSVGAAVIAAAVVSFVLIRKKKKTA